MDRISSIKNNISLIREDGVAARLEVGIGKMNRMKKIVIFGFGCMSLNAIANPAYCSNKLIADVLLVNRGAGTGRFLNEADIVNAGLDFAKPGHLCRKGPMC